MILLLVLFAFASTASAQDFTYRGFGEVQSTIYAQRVPHDPDRIGVEARVRLEPAYRPAAWLTASGSLDLRTDTLEQVERTGRFDVRDRGAQRPVMALRHAVGSIRRGPLVVDIGKQFIRWGKADILNPTDRFAPRDFVEVTEDEFLAVTGARVQLERGAHMLDAVWVPVFTPSRIPLSNRRWAPPIPQTAGPSVQFDSESASFPERPQYGARWNVRGSALELSVSYFDGFNHLPHFASRVVSPGLVAVQRAFAPLRVAGADGAVPLRWFTLKGEAAWLTTTSDIADDVVMYVAQLERQVGELSLVGGYAGEIVTAGRTTFDFAPDRGLTRAFLGRAAYTLGPTSDLAAEVAVRQNLDGVWLKGQYSRAVDVHWRWTVAGAVIGGHDRDFIGQYRRNSHLLATLRYSF